MWGVDGRVYKCWVWVGGFIKMWSIDGRVYKCGV